MLGVLGNVVPFAKTEPLGGKYIAKNSYHRVDGTSEIHAQRGGEPSKREAAVKQHLAFKQPFSFLQRNEGKHLTGGGNKEESQERGGQWVCTYRKGSKEGGHTFTQTMYNGIRLSPILLILHFQKKQKVFAEFVPCYKEAKAESS